MASSFGLAITNLTSKFGVLSRKASIRLATETGEKVLARKGELGRNLNAEEIEQVFAEVLPKRCRPKIITTKAEVKDCMKNGKLNDEQIRAQFKALEGNYMAAATVGNGTKRLPIWIPNESESVIPQELKAYLELESPALVAHETEHALEKNCRIIDIFKRKTYPIRTYFNRLFDKNYMDKNNSRQVGIHNFEGEMQKELARTIIGLKPETNTMVLNCEPTAEAISEKFGNKNGLADMIRRLFRKSYASAENKGTDTNKRLKLMRYWMDMERPAYEVTGNIERKIYGLSEGEHAPMTGVAKGYEAAIQVAKEERKLYWKNKFLGRLKKPNIYMTDKDILSYAATKEERAMLNDIIQGLSEEQKSDLVWSLYKTQKQKNVIQNLYKFLEVTKINGKSPYAEEFKILSEVNFEQLMNPDVIAIANTSKEYRHVIDLITKAKPERIREFSKIAGTKDKNIIDEATRKRSIEMFKFLGNEYNPPEYCYRYLTLSEHLDHPNFNELKAFVDIKMPDGTYPYSSGMITYAISKLPEKELKEFLTKAQEAAKEGKNIEKEIEMAYDKLHAA